ncbi:BTB/POZ/MATH-domains containing protein [Artemisia annua]|uniref:BTB/POZ/MATH-domains containing protein n=1 Tax=Artemisia annua TaxID=35608 RepID=A0A2U1NGT2_ARTAN|nr:BTB/POZ/MATH-domains containing protein [Artemisia annua]
MEIYSILQKNCYGQKITCNGLATEEKLWEIRDRFATETFSNKYATETFFYSVIQTEGYKYVEQTCPIFLSDLLVTVVSVDVDERPAGEGRRGLSRKISGRTGAGCRGTICQALVKAINILLLHNRLVSGKNVAGIDINDRLIFEWSLKFKCYLFVKLLIMSATINGFHLFTVKEYSRAKEMDAGSDIPSDTFTAGGYDWQVYFFPHGEDVSVCLELVNDGLEVEASFEFTLLDQSGKGVHNVNNDISIELYKKGDACYLFVKLLIMSVTINGFHLFTVKEYSRAKEMDAGSDIPSDTFTAGGYDWQVYFFPHGEDVSVCLELVNDGLEVEASFEFTLLDQSGKGVHNVNNDISIELYKKGDAWGYDFMKKLDLESSDYLKDDSLSICCMVGVVQSCIRPKNFTIIPPPPEIEKDFKYLLDHEIGSDIVFRVKGVTFKAHKVILAARSPVFRAQFYGLVGNPALDEVELMDIEPLVFKAMLFFIYSDKLPDSQVSMGSMSNMIQHLLVAADRFGLDRLKHLCEAKFCEELNVDVVATTLSFAHDHHCSQLKTFCLNFATANLRAVMQTEGYKYVKQTCPLLLSELLETVASVAVDERPGEGGGVLSRKRSGSSVMGLDLAAAQMPAAAESGEPYVRRLRRRL